MIKAKEKTNMREKKIPEKKKKLLAELIGLIEKSNTIMIVSMLNLEALQFQKLKRVLKDKATIKVVKKNIMLKALEQFKAKKKDIDKLESSLVSGFAILFSQLDSFELAAILSENKNPAKVKTGQIAPQDIIVMAGPTDLIAGPVISELTKVKIRAAIDGGKIVIKENCMIAKKGEIINIDAASVLAKLDITPISVGLEPLASYDNIKQKIYKEIRVNKEETLKELKDTSAMAFAFSLEIGYPSKDNIKMLISKLNNQTNALFSLVK